MTAGESSLTRTDTRRRRVSCRSRAGFGPTALRMKIAALSFDVVRGDVSANLATVERAVARAARAGVRLVLLPEMWSTSFVDGELDPDGRPWVEAAEHAAGELARLSARFELALAGSSLGRADDAALPRNRFQLFDRGEERLRYDKVHLFSPTAEAASFSAGDTPPPTIVLDGLSVSCAICYDLRFAAIFEAAGAQRAELLLVPAQWPSARAGHWRALVVGRAVENQAWVLAANRTGTDLVGRRRLELAFSGNSLVVDPHGNVRAEGDGTAGLTSAVIDPEVARRLRAHVPVAQDRRDELYFAWRRERGTR